MRNFGSIIGGDGGGVQLKRFIDRLYGQVHCPLCLITRIDMHSPFDISWGREYKTY